MDYQARASQLQRMRAITEQTLSGREKSEQFVIPVLQPVVLPEDTLLTNLVSLSNNLRSDIKAVYDTSLPTLTQIRDLRTKKQNIEKLVDMVTSIIEIKRLSFGLGSSPQELYTNTKNYLELRDKVLFSDKHIQAIQGELERTRTQYRQLFDKAVKESSSENLEVYSRILSLIPDKAQNPTSSSEGLVQLYCREMKKELQSVERDLFEIPIEVATIDDKYDYIFFQLVNNTLKKFVAKLKIYQENTRKLYGEGKVLSLVVSLIEKALDPLLSDIFKRQTKYFRVSNSTEKRNIKDILRLKHFCSEYGSILNQIQRFVIYLNETAMKQSSDPASRNKLEQAVNFEALIDMNTCLIENSKQLVQLQLNYLCEESPFVNSILHFNKELMRTLEKEDQVDLKSQQEFLDKLSLIFKRAISRACKTINPVIALSLIDYSSILMNSESTLNVFTELIERHIMKGTVGSPSQLALIITLNCLAQLPATLKKQLESLKIPVQLNKQLIESQISELKSANVKRVREEVKSHCKRIISLPHFQNLLESDYKQLVAGWKKLHKSAFDIFVEACCEAHCYKLAQTTQRRKFDNVSLLAFEKEVRGIVSQYENMSPSVNVFGKFRMVLTLMSVLLVEDPEDVKRLLKDLSPEEQQGIEQILAQRRKS